MYDRIVFRLATLLLTIVLELGCQSVVAQEHGDRRVSTIRMTSGERTNRFPLDRKRDAHPAKLKRQALGFSFFRSSTVDRPKPNDWRPYSSLPSVRRRIGARREVPLAHGIAPEIPCDGCTTTAPLRCQTSLNEPKLEEGDCFVEGRFRDVYVLDVETSSRIRIEVESESIDTVLFLLDSDCREVAANDDCVFGSTDSCLEAGLGVGRYSVVVTSFDERERGSYRIEAACMEASCERCKPAPISCPQTLVGNLAAAQCPDLSGRFADTYEIVLAAPTRLQAEVRSDSFGVVVRLADSDCVDLVTGSACTENPTSSCLTADIPPGSYFLSISTRGEGQTGSYEIELSCIDAADLCGACVSAELTCGRAIEGQFPGGECTISDGRRVELFRVSIAERTQVRLGVESLEFDSVLFLLDAMCNEIARNDDCGVNDTSRSCLTLELDPGTYTVGVTSFLRGESGAYRLNLDCGADSSCLDCSAGSFSCNEVARSAAGTPICLDDDGGAHQVWSFDLAEDRAVDLRVAANSPHGNLKIELLDRGCLPMGVGIPCAPDSSCLLVRRLQQEETLVRVSALDGQSLEAYELSATCTDFHPCQSCEIGRLTCSEAFSGVLDGRDCLLQDGTLYEAWSFSLSERRQLDLSLESEEFDAFLILVDTECGVIESNDDCAEQETNACLSTVLEQGSYFVLVNTFGAGSGPYDLRFDCVEVDEGVKPGDCNVDAVLNITDGICLLNMLFLGQSSVFSCGEKSFLELPIGDFDGALGVNLTDAIALFTHLFLGGPAHALGNDCVVVESCEPSC